MDGRARGVPRGLAEDMMTIAFIAEAVQEIEDESLQEEIVERAEAWLERLDASRGAVMPILESTYGPTDAALWFRRWRIFFMACAELFGYGDGRQWLVGHYRFRRPQ